MLPAGRYTTRSTGRPVEGVRTPAAPQSTPTGHSHLPEEGHRTSQASNIPIFVLGDQDAYYNVSSATITQAPAQLLPVESLVLCPAFDPAFPSLTKCPLGAACRHVHADVTGLPLIEVHVNYAWRSLEDVAYPRHEGSTVRVAPPNPTYRFVPNNISNNNTSAPVHILSVPAYVRDFCLSFVNSAAAANLQRHPAEVRLCPGGICVDVGHLHQSTDETRPRPRTRLTLVHPALTSTSILVSDGDYSFNSWAVQWYDATRCWDSAASAAAPL
jgi:hypothetical protein